MAVSPDPLLRIPHLYHFTDVSNLPSIREADGLLSTALLREVKQEFCAGGDDDSLVLDIRCGMDKYVHLCFDERHPMAYRLKERKPDANLIYLKVDRAILHQPDVMFSTGVGYANNAEVVTLVQAVERQLIDFEVMYTRMDWRVLEIQRRRRSAELCEILVPDYVALKFIKNMPNG
jgi:ssDNA thymidine ADP-ribosyltransferase, DarT